MSDRPCSCRTWPVAVAGPEATREPSASSSVLQLLGWAVRERRRAADLQQAELARRAKVTRQQLSALELADSERRVGPDQLRNVDDALDAGGSLLRLYEAANSTGPGQRQRFELTLAARRDPDSVPLSRRLLLNALDLRDRNSLNTYEAERTAQAALALNRRTSTTQNQPVLLALRILGPAALAGLTDELEDDRHTSPWRALAALPHLTHPTASRMPGGHDRSSVDALLHIAKRWEGNAHLVPWARPLIDALALLAERNALNAQQSGRAARFLRQVVADEAQFPESRHLADRLLAKLEPERTYIPRHFLESSDDDWLAGKHPPMPREWLGALKEAAGTSHTKLSLLAALLAGDTEESRRQAALVLLAAGWGRWAAEVYEQLAKDLSPAGLSYVLRNPLGVLAQPTSAPMLLGFAQHFDPVVRAHAAWALSRQTSVTPEQETDMKRWLQRETYLRDGAFPVLALSQIAQDLEWQAADPLLPQTGQSPGRGHDTRSQAHR